jgi:S-adenosylmethionine:tRNA ribosyltransferase-isomerase
MSRPWTLADFDFDLPPGLIAQQPAAERSASRLLDATSDPAVDRVFRELPDRLDPRDLLVVNDTRVIRARLLGAKASGGAVEALVERVLPDREVLAHVRASKPPRTGGRIRFAGATGDAFEAEVLGRAGAPGTPEASLFRLRFPDEPHALLERHGHVPLPPYIAHAGDADDAQRYQTVFARAPGAVAAPTAALHFDEALLARLDERGIARTAITLHVGAGTFQPVRTESIDAHAMHRERYEIPSSAVTAIDAARARGGRIVAVGTTSLRALEAAAAEPGGLAAGARETALFITPGYRFRVVDLLVTNFHLPKSTLLMLVSAFAGHDRMRALYAHAIATQYRFFSYGDAMLLRRA